MKVFRIFSSLLVISAMIYLISCDTNKNQIVTQPINRPDVEDCYDNYINNGGTCRDGAWTCFHIKKNGVERTVCDGFLEIKGYTCTNEYFECVIPLSETMACKKDLETGPRVPYGNYVYRVCCNLGGGETNVTVPLNGQLDIDLTWQCDINSNGNNN